MRLRASKKCVFLSLFITLIWTSWNHLQGQSCIPYDYAHDRQLLCPCHLLYGLEGLYWTVFQPNLDYAVDFERNQSPGLKKIYFFHHDWKCGTRLWLGWNWGCGWEVKWIYSRYLTKNHGSTNSHNSNCGLKASLLHPAKGSANAKKASGHHQLKYQTVDLQVERVLSFYHHTFVLRPFFGCRFLRLEQNLKVIYKREDFSWELSDIVKWKSSLNTIGLHGGVEMNMRCVSGFGVYGTIAGSLLGGRTRNRHRQGEKKFNNDGALSNDIDLKEKWHVMIPELCVSAGLSWDCDDRNCVLYKLKLGYELEDYFHTPQLRRYQSGNGGASNSANAGQVALQGVTFSVEIYF